MTSRALRIGQLANASGLTPDAIRFYEREGLLPSPVRTAGGFRRYDETTVDRLTFIRQAKTHGLSLREIRDLLASQGRTGHDRCRRVRELVEKRLRLLEKQRRELDTFCSTLQQYLVMCDRALAEPERATCPVIEDLRKEAQHV